MRKRLVLIVLISLLGVFVGCSSSDDGGTTAPSNNWDQMNWDSGKWQ